MNLLQRINRWGYKKKDNLQDVPEQKFIGRKMPWFTKSLRIEKRRGTQLGDIRWYGWVRYFKWSLVSVLFLIASRGLEFYVYGKETETNLYLLTLILFFILYVVDWKWGETQSNQIRYDLKTMKLRTYKDGEWGYQTHRDLHLRDLLVVAQAFVIYFILH